jgi:hypothetical protein
LVGFNTLGDTMKNKRIVRRKKLAKMEKKRIVRNERRKNVKQHIVNTLKPKKRDNKVAINAR